METTKNISTETTPKTILVTGDFVIDHHVIKGKKTDASGLEKIGTSFVSTYGGAKLSYDLIDKIAGALKTDIKCFWSFINMPKKDSTQGTIHDSYLRWELYEKNGVVQSCKLIDKLGFGGNKNVETNDWLQFDLNQAEEVFDTIFVDEAGIGFRDNPKAWPDFSKTNKIIFKTTNPLCEGLLWYELLKFRKNLTIITNLNQLKHYNIKVSNNISWEQTALDIVYGIQNNVALSNLLKASEVIVTIGSAGAIYIKTNTIPELNEYTLVFDPENLENEWEHYHSNDIINDIGLGSSFVSGFITAGKKQTVDNIKVGLNTMNAAMLNGIFVFNNNSFEINDLSKSLTVRYYDRYYSSAFIPSPAWKSGLEYLNNSDWSILENNYENYKDKYIQKPDFFNLAFNLAENGINTLHYAPRLKLEKVTVIDRNEIENLRNIRAQIDFYNKNQVGKNPLNIAVFGAPGAGKSFIVKELANTVLKDKNKLEFLTFNLSQFKEESELYGPFHAIRDAVLRGKLPVVFWDEFDSEDYKWLKSMIGPMQDGVFQEGKDTHPIGKCIFIFAGGTTYTMQHFSGNMEAERYIIKKGPDFVSRIVCSLNVFGLNQKPYYNETEKKWYPNGDKTDICFAVRRAQFIRTMLEAKDNVLMIDKNLLHALIEINLYKCGSRGLERILKTLAAHKDRKIELSDLPSKDIINMNTDYNKFVKLLSEKSIEEQVSLENMAISIHNSWLDHNATHSVYYKDYVDLSYDSRLDNIEAAKRIEKVIEKSGKFRLVTKMEFNSKQLEDASEAFADYIQNEGNLDFLAEEEHIGWMETRINGNWVLGERSDYHRIHDCLVPFNDLDKGVDDRKLQKQKNKDRDSILKYPEVLNNNGFVIVPINNQK